MQTCRDCARSVTSLETIIGGDPNVLWLWNGNYYCLPHFRERFGFDPHWAPDVLGAEG